MVSNFIQNTKEKLRLDISQHTPKLKEYDNIKNQLSYCYHLLNIELYIWRKSWNEHIQLVTEPTRPNEFTLMIKPGLAPVAVGDNESIHNLRTYIEDVTPNLVSGLNHLKNERKCCDTF